MTKQQWLDKLRDANLAGRFPSINVTGGCAYRGQNGTACAVGINIPDELWKAETNRMTVTELLFKQPELREHLLPEGVEHTYEIKEIQRVHDGLANDVWLGVARWNHEVFMVNLLATKFFAGMTPTPKSEGVKDEQVVQVG